MAALLGVRLNDRRPAPICMGGCAAQGVGLGGPSPVARTPGLGHRHHHGPPTVVLATARFACAKSICVLDLRARRGTALAFVLCACLKQRRLAGGDLQVLSGSFLSVPGRVARVLISARESARFLNVTVS